MTIDRETIGVYETRADVYEASRPPRFADGARALAATTDGVVLDGGCGTGAYLGPLGTSSVGLDASAAMLGRATSAGRPLVRADLGRLPFRPGGLGAAWARNSYVHLPHPVVPLALAELHRSLPAGAAVVASFIAGPDDHVVADDDLPGRNFWRWSDEHLTDVFVGAGFEDVELSGERPRFVHARDRKSVV